MAENNRDQVMNTFSGGMNSDADKSIISKNQYIYSENFRLFGDNPNTIGSLENVSGNQYISDFISDIYNYTPNGYYIAGYCNIRDELYLLVTQNTTLGQTGYSRIVQILFDTSGYPSSATTIYDDQFSSDESRLLWNNLPDYRIKAVGRYESNDIKKIYFVDGYNIFRSINVASVSPTSPVSKFDVIPNFNLSTPQFVQFGSGSLTSGKIQYAYQMYDLHGGETLFSPASVLISVSSTSGQSGSNKSFKGSDIGVNTGKGIRISIQPPSSYNRIRVVSIKYNSINSIPVIKIIADQDISINPGIIYFYDSGETVLGEYTYEQFAIIGRGVFSASEIEDKNNYLFVANIKEQDWDIDFDARSFRFVSSSATGTITPGHSVIFDSGLWGSASYYNLSVAPYPSHEVKINGTLTIPYNLNCINSYNDISLDWTRSDSSPSYPYLYNYKYQANGTTIGGTGTNVSYTFVQDKELVLSNTGTSYIDDYCYNTDYSNASVEITSTGYQRDEVYRFGIVFYDVKGRPSTVKWIGDIRFPKYLDSFTSTGNGPSDYSPFFNYNGVEYFRPLGIKFTVYTTPAISLGAKYFKIVRVKRESHDRTILAQGVIPTSILHYDNVASGYSYNPFTLPYTALTTRAGITKQNNILEFISPEVNFNKDLTYLNGDILELIGKSTTVHQWDNFSNISVTVGTMPVTATFSHTLKYGGFQPWGAFVNNLSILGGQLIGPAPKVLNANFQDGVNIIPMTYKFWNITMSNMSGNNRFGLGGTKMVLQTIDTGARFATSSYLSYYANYKRNVFNSQYGGNTYTNRQLNSYISCSDPIVCNGSVTTSVFRGDTYIGMFDYLSSIATGDIPDTSKAQIVMYFPVETSINLRYREDSCYSKSNDDSNHSRRFMQELAGTYTVGPITYNQPTDLYKYNSVYSQQDTTISYFPKSDIITSGIKVFDNRVLSSELKIDNEPIDSWTMFKMDNFLDVESKYGKITTLLHKDNYLYFWQPKAFGVLSVAQRSLMSDNNQGQLVIGTGGILDRYDYISTNEGCSTRFSVVEGLKGLYWYDSTNQGIYRYSGNEGVKSLSITKGINTIIKSYIPLNTESISGYDKVYNEVLFTLPEISNTLVFNEIFDSFNGVYTFYPSNLIKPNGSPYYISTNRAIRRTLDDYGFLDILYIHTPISNRGSFFNVIYPSTIKLLVNDKYNETKVFDGIHFESSSKALLNGTYHIDQIYTTFDTIRCYNDYQNSGFQTIYTSGVNQNITRQEREFKLNIPRNIVNTSSLSNPDILNNSNLDATRLFKERMRDKYLIIDLSYNNHNMTNNVNYIFNIPYITTNYRISKR